MAKKNNGYRGKKPYRDDVRDFERKPPYMYGSYVDEDERRYGRYDERRDRPQYRNDERRDRPVNNGMTEVRLKRFKKENILIADLNDKEYVIDGNRASEFITEMLDTRKEWFELDRKMKENPNDEDAAIAMRARVMDILKKWCLTMINCNVSGDKYTMDDVTRGFNDINALMHLMSVVTQHAERHGWF